MRNDEIVRKNISLAFDFLRYLTDHPELIEELPDECELEFLDKDFPFSEQGAGFKGTGKGKKYLRLEHTFNIAT